MEEILPVSDTSKSAALPATRATPSGQSQPSSATQPPASSSPKIPLLVLIAALIFLLAAFLIWRRFEPARPQVAPSPTPEAVASTSPQVMAQVNRQVPEGPLFGIWGTITKIERDQERLGLNNIEVGAGTLHVAWDLDPSKIYQVQVSENYLVNVYGKAVAKETPKLRKRQSWSNLSVGDRLYIGARIDFGKYQVIPTSELEEINLYLVQ